MYSLRRFRSRKGNSGLNLWHHGILLCAFPLFILAQTQPKPAASTPDYSQEAFIIEQITRKVAFENDGTATTEATSRVRIQSDAGVQRWGLLSFSYCSSVEEVSIDYVRARKPDGTTIPTPLEDTQDIPSQVTREAPFYSDLREKQVAVKGLSVGDMLEYQVHWQLTKPLAPSQFWTAYSFTHDSIVREERLEISVPRERPAKFRSPTIKPAISEEGTRRVYLWATSNLQLELEENKGKNNARKTILGQFPPPDVILSSFQSWDEVGQWYDGLQKDRLRPTPEIVAKAAELTKDARDEEAKIRALYNYVSTQFRYIGIAFGIGRYQPRSAAEVLANKYGDCKDKHTLLASLLQAAGISAYPALINTTRAMDQDVPSPAQFDHLISVVPHGKGFFWLDTTTEVAPLGYLMTPLRDKQALVIPSDRQAVFATTPRDPPFDSVTTFKIEAKLSDSGTLDGRVDRSDRGDVEVLLRSKFRRTARSQWKNLVQGVSYSSGFGGTVTDVDVSVPEATDAPFRLSYSYNRAAYGGDWENRRITVPLPSILLPTIENDGDKSSDPIWLGSPQEMEFESRLELPDGYKPELPQNIDITRDFAEYHASYDFDQGLMIARRRLLLKAREIPVGRYEEYKLFQKAVEDDRNRYFGLTSGSPSARTNAPTTDRGVSFWEAVSNLPDSRNPEAVQAEADAGEAYHKNSVQAAIYAARSAVATDPKFVRAWIFLAGVLVDSGQIERAIEAYHKAIEADLHQPLSYEGLAILLMSEGRYEEAVEVCEDLLKIEPESATALLNLGSAEMKLGRAAEAASNLESALRVLPASVSLQIQLGEAYSRSGKSDKAFAAFSKALEIQPGARTESSIAYTLAEAHTDLKDALQWAESAVRRECQASTQVTLSHLIPEDLVPTQNLAAYWDTLGWVHFQLGNLDQAERYLGAAWTLSQHAIVGNHLGQVYERKQKKQEAIKSYATAVAANDRMKEPRERLIALLGNSAAVTTAVNNARSELSQMRSTHLTQIVSGSASSDFFVLFSQRAKVEEVKFVSGSEELRSAGQVLRSAKFNVLFPDDEPTRLVRRGVLACSAISGCEFVLMTPNTVRSVD
ncbi:MAG TPA: DUF3857 domain-containing protein [Terriglobales bacterium]|jgi:tetratricopeptide (TPR) repeat protein/transglutaminase-like putative cysteine protease|nr:DUF3857 domain-containing protein [Terriglobales bacterium]